MSSKSLTADSWQQLSDQDLLWQFFSTCWDRRGWRNAATTEAESLKFASEFTRKMQLLSSAMIRSAAPLSVLSHLDLTIFWRRLELFEWHADRIFPNLQDDSVAGVAELRSVEYDLTRLNEVWIEAPDWSAFRMGTGQPGREAASDCAILLEQDGLIDGQIVCQLARDICGNPFLPISLDDDVLEKVSKTIAPIASQMYKRRDFSLINKIIIMLCNLGLQYSDIIRHCELSTNHFRGCWLIDFSLGVQY
jgi:hypothetical protein